MSRDDYSEKVGKARRNVRKNTPEILFFYQSKPPKKSVFIFDFLHWSIERMGKCLIEFHDDSRFYLPLLKSRSNIWISGMERFQISKPSLSYRKSNQESFIVTQIDM